MKTSAKGKTRTAKLMTRYPHNYMHGATPQRLTGHLPEKAASLDRGRDAHVASTWPLRGGPPELGLLRLIRGALRVATRVVPLWVIYVRSLANPLDWLHSIGAVQLAASHVQRSRDIMRS